MGFDIIFLYHWEGHPIRLSSSERLEIFSSNICHLFNKLKIYTFIYLKNFCLFSLIIYIFSLEIYISYLQLNSWMDLAYFGKANYLVGQTFPIIVLLL